MRHIHIISKDFKIFEDNGGLRTAVPRDSTLCLLIAQIVIDNLLKMDDKTPEKKKSDKGMLKTFMKMREKDRRLIIAITAKAYMDTDTEDEADRKINELLKAVVNHVER